MKTFDEIFPELQPTDKYLIWVDGDEVWVTQEFDKCCVCSNDTRFISISFWAHFCSIKCLNQMWNNYYTERDAKLIEEEEKDDSQMSMFAPGPGPHSWPTESGDESNQGPN